MSFDGVKLAYIYKNENSKFIINNKEPAFETYKEAKDHALENGYQIMEKTGNIFVTICNPIKVFQD